MPVAQLSVIYRVLQTFTAHHNIIKGLDTL